MTSSQYVGNISDMETIAPTNSHIMLELNLASEESGSSKPQMKMPQICKCRFCMLWDTSHKSPGWVCINKHSMKRVCFKSKRGTFAGICFGCAE